MPLLSFYSSGKHQKSSDFLILLILLGRTILLCRNQSIDLHSKLVDWFLYDRDLGLERIKGYRKILGKTTNTIDKYTECAAESIKPIKCQCCPHIETSQLIYCANQLTGFYMRATLALDGLKTIIKTPE